MIAVGTMCFIKARVTERVCLARKPQCSCVCLAGKIVTVAAHEGPYNRFEEPIRCEQFPLVGIMGATDDELIPIKPEPERESLQGEQEQRSERASARSALAALSCASALAPNAR